MKRFIAGAKCKNCNAEEHHITMGKRGSLHCVECKFSEKRNEARIVVQEWTPVRPGH